MLMVASFDIHQRHMDWLSLRRKVINQWYGLHSSGLLLVFCKELQLQGKVSLEFCFASHDWIKSIGREGAHVMMIIIVINKWIDRRPICFDQNTIFPDSCRQKIILRILFWNWKAKTFPDNYKFTGQCGVENYSCRASYLKFLVVIRHHWSQK